MPNVDVSMSVRELAASLANLSAGFREQAVPIALNDMVKQVRTQASRQIRQTYNIKSAVLKKNMVIKFAMQSNLTASVIASVGSLPVAAFNARQTKTGVAVTIKKGNTKTIAHAFIATMQSGHRGAFVRTGDARFPIKELFTIGPSRAFASKAVQAAMITLIQTKFPQILAGKIEYLLKRQQVQAERDAGIF